MPTYHLDPDVEPLYFELATYKRLCAFYEGYLIFPLIPFHQFCNNIAPSSEKYYYTAKCTFVVCKIDESDFIVPVLLFDEYLTEDTLAQRAYNQFKFTQIRKMGLPYTNLDEDIELPILPKINPFKPSKMTANDGDIPF